MKSMRLVEDKVRKDDSDLRSDEVIYVDGHLMYSGRIYLPKALMDHWKCDLKTCITTDWEPGEYLDLVGDSESDDLVTTYELVKAERDGDYWNVLVKIEVNGTLHFPGSREDRRADEQHDNRIDEQLRGSY
jgi:hypothetical protein